VFIKERNVTRNDQKLSPFAMFKGLFALSKKCCEDKGLEADGEKVNF